MCKITAVAGVSKANHDNLWKFAHAILPSMTVEDRDAVGYAAFRDTLYGERWLNPNIALVSRPMRCVGKLSTSKELVEDARYSSFGKPQVNHVSSLILHSRFATCDATLENAHPFVSLDGKTALIHNGVVSPRGLEYITSTCDSEGILNEYVTQDVANNPKNIQKVVNKLTGQFACAVLTEDNYGKKYMDLFRNDQYPTLFTAYVDELGTNVFCTLPQYIEDAVTSLGWSMGTMFQVKDNTYMRFDAVTGLLLQEFEVVKERVVRRMAAKKGKK